MVTDDCGQSSDGGDVFLFVFGRGWHNLSERLEEVRGHNNLVVVLKDYWDGPERWEKAVSSCETVASGHWNEHFRQSVVVGGHAGHVCFNCVGGVCKYCGCRAR